MKVVEFKFENGQEVSDVVSGFTGIIDCSSIWLNGCKRYSVQPKVKAGENTKPESVWFDEEQLSLKSSGIADKVDPTPTGGPSFSSESAKKR